MNNLKKLAIFFYVFSGVCIISSIIFFCSSLTGMAILWLSIGSLNLSLATIWMNRSNNSKYQDKQENK